MSRWAWIGWVALAWLVFSCGCALALGAWLGRQDPQRRDRGTGAHPPEHSEREPTDSGAVPTDRADRTRPEAPAASSQRKRGG